MSSKEASTSSLDRRHAATRETVPQPRHVARLVFSTAARPSQRCDVTAFHVRSPPACDTRTSVRPGWIELPVPQELRSTHFILSSPFRPSIGPRLRGNSCALQLRLFCFSVSSQKLFANDI